MKPLDLIKKRVAETKDRRMRAELETEQLKKTEAAIYAEASEIAGRPLASLEDIEQVRDERAEETKRHMREMAEALQAIGQLTDADVALLRREGYLS